MIHIMKQRYDACHDACYDTHHDADHVYTQKSEFRSKKSRNFFLNRYGQDSNAPFNID
jgi:hypothetical protein